MTEWSSPLANALHERVDQATIEDLRTVVRYFIGYKPTAVVVAFDVATRLREEVEETLRQ